MKIEVAPIIQLWLLRLLVPLGAYRDFVGAHEFSNERLAEVIGLGDWVNSESRDYDKKQVQAELRKLHQAAEREMWNTPAPVCLHSNVTRLAELVGLSAVDCHILEFAILIQNERLLDDAADWLGNLTSLKAFYVLSVVLDIPEQEVRASLSAGGVLANSGLLAVDRSGAMGLSRKLNLLSDHFADIIVSTDSDPVGLLRDRVVLSSLPQLRLTDYDHVTPSLSVLRPYLKQSIVTGRKGVNIFLHGDPGTGKSQLARVLAQDLGCELFEVSSEDEDGDPVNGEGRLRAFRAAQSFFSQRRSLILFDDVEDVFNDGDGFFGRKSTAQTKKAWINRTLEENPVPTFWLSNSVHQLDPAFIRRFDIVFELPVPPRVQRERIILNACSDFFDESSMARIIDQDSLAPAVVTRAASVVRSIRDQIDQSALVPAFELLISNILAAQGHKPIQKNDPNRLPGFYDPCLIHADSDLNEVSNGLSQAKSGRLCLYGPPGTGKTAYGRWLAEQMGVPLMVKRASDLMSKWVGDNEKNIATAFKQAERDGALLLIDEADSFLQDRRGAQRGWEVSMVNEMLAQMESFSGVFIASTNLMEGLDQAALRRFDLKVKFDYLRSEQGWELLHRHCAQMKMPVPDASLLERIKCMTQLTPGDFAAVARQHRFRPIENPSALVLALEAECAVKEGGKASVGFV
jgi:SpoVK/Ycf46/Vps4 family AAA+-type ATPase